MWVVFGFFLYIRCYCYASWNTGSCEQREQAPTTYTKGESHRKGCIMWKRGMTNRAVGTMKSESFLHRKTSSMSHHSCIMTSPCHLLFLYLKHKSITWFVIFSTQKGQHTSDIIIYVYDLFFACVDMTCGTTHRICYHFYFSILQNIICDLGSMICCLYVRTAHMIHNHKLT